MSERFLTMVLKYPVPPERIFAGPYESVLTNTDYNSGKLGQATISFEIVDDAPAASMAAAPAAPAASAKK